MGGRGEGNLGDRWGGCEWPPFLLRWYRYFDMGKRKGGMKMYCQECGQHADEDAKFCQNCGKRIGQAGQVQEEQSEAHKEQTVQPLSRKSLNQGFSIQYNKNGNPKIGGWLCLIGALLSTKFIYTTFNLLTYLPLVSNKVLQETEFLFWIKVEFSFFIFLILYNIFVLKLFFQTKRNFPKQCLWFIFSPVIFTVIECMMLYLSKVNIEILNSTVSSSIGPVFWSVLVGAVIGVYLTQSKRVEQTFIK